MLATFVWDPNRIFFKIPVIGYPVTWYGCFFALGFMVGYSILRHIFTEVFVSKGQPRLEAKEVATSIMDRFGVVGAVCAVLGARLGYVFFYGWPYYREHPLDIFKVWEGGLASHGAAFCVLLGILFFIRRWKKPKLSFLFVLDSLVIAACFAGGCIRLGNFMNQEITGLPTTMPWGVSFLHPMDNAAGIPLHPVQLYESVFYFFLFCALYAVWRLRGKEVGSGFISGCFFISLFSFRFLIEFFKIHQGEVLSVDFPLRMGQLLSLPFVALGISLLFRSKKKYEVAQ